MGGKIFQDLTRSETFVDQSDLLEFTNSCLNTNRKYICVSRPRRFGKSVTISMLEGYYSKGKNSKDLFDQLKISDKKDYLQHLNQYHVIRITMTDYCGRGAYVNSAEEFLQDFTKDLCDVLYENYEDLLPEDETEPDRLLSIIYRKTEEPFVFLIDEWDVLMRRFPHQEDVKKAYLDLLRTIFKDKEYVALAYMTGILPIKKYGEHSALNMFEEISVLNAGPLAKFTGLTDEDVQNLCDQFEVNYEEISEWYDGYRIPGVNGNVYSVYNPVSVTKAVLTGNFESYWTATETYEALKQYIVMNQDGLKEKIQYLVDGNRLFINTSGFTNDLSSFNNADSVLTALVHLGYLTFEKDPDSAKEKKTDKGFVWIPNVEIRNQFEDTLSDIPQYNGLLIRLRNSKALLDAVLNGDEQKTAEAVKRAHAEYSDVLHYNSEESLAAVLLQAFQCGWAYYTIRREMPAGEGFADLYFDPLKSSDYPPMIVELKYNSNAETAIKQIHDRHYFWTVSDPSYKEAVLVGIDYDRETKEHHCIIERVPLENH